MISIPFHNQQNGFNLESASYKEIIKLKGVNKWILLIGSEGYYFFMKINFGTSPWDEWDLDLENSERFVTLFIFYNSFRMKTRNAENAKPENATLFKKTRADLFKSKINSLQWKYCPRVIFLSSDNSPSKMSLFKLTENFFNLILPFREWPTCVARWSPVEEEVETKRQNAFNSLSFIDLNISKAGLFLRQSKDDLSVH